MRNIEETRICDITLCQGEKSPKMSFRETIELCKMLDKLDVDYIALKGIKQSKTDSLLIRSVSQAVKNARIAVPVSIIEEKASVVWEALKEAKSPRLQVIAPVSSVQMEYLYHLKPDVLLSKVCSTLEECGKYTSDLELIAVDATRSDISFLEKMISGAIGAGAKTVTICDTAGSMLPEETSAFLDKLQDRVPALKDITLGYSCSDTMKLADACCLAAVQSGAREIKASAFPTDSISMRNIIYILNIKQRHFGVRIKPGTEKIDTLTNQINNLCQTGLGHSFHSSHSDDLKNDTITINAHESSKSVSDAIRKMGYDLSEEDFDKVWQRFSAVSRNKERITLKELEAIVATEAMQVPPVCSDIQYLINTGSAIGAMAHMKLMMHGKQVEGIATGDGAIDAAFNSIEKATGRHFELDDFQIQSVTEGREAMGETLVRLRSDGKLYSGKGISTDIVGAGIMAYVNAINKILYEEEEA